jgi:hypothetical protein
MISDEAVSCVDDADDDELENVDEPSVKRMVNDIVDDDVLLVGVGSVPGGTDRQEYP